MERMTKNKKKPSTAEYMLYRLNDHKLIDLWERASNKYVEHHENAWQDREDVYSANRVWDKKSIATISGALGDLNGKLGLDIGCGGGQKSILLRGGTSKLIVTDISANAVKKTLKKSRKENISFEGVQCNGELLPFKDNTFDYIISNDVIEHVPGDRSLLAEAGRVIKATGIITIEIPNIYDLRTFFLDFVFVVTRGLLFKILRLSPIGTFRGHIHLYTYRSFSELATFSGLKSIKVFSVYSPALDTYPWMGGYFHGFPTRDINMFIIRIIKLLITMFPRFSLYTYVFCLGKGEKEVMI